MPKSLIVEIVVPSSSRPSSMLSWLNKLLNSHRMSALTVSEILPPKEQAQQLIHVLTNLEVSATKQGKHSLSEALGLIACHFECCEEIMRKLPR